MLIFLIRTLENTRLFFKRHPALYLGLIAYLSVSCAFEITFLIPLFFFLLIFPKALNALLCLLFFLRAFTILPEIPPPNTISNGFGIFYPEKVQLQAAFFQKTHRVQGLLKQFNAANDSYRNLPCSFILQKEQDLSHAFLFEGSLHISPQSKAHLTLKKVSPIPNTFSLCQIRFKLHKSFSEFLHKHIHSSKTSALFIALLSGQIEEKTLSLEFTKLGLSHILAISGFHFSLIATFLLTLLRLILPKKLAGLLVILMLILFALFVGASASVLRASLMSVLALSILFQEKRGSSLNYLGIALLLICLFFPDLTTSIGFILSFLCTFSLLFFHQLVDKHLQLLFPKRPRALFLFIKKDQGLFALSALLRKTLALNLSVFLWTFPLTLFFFQSFPLLSLAYNLFIPFLLGLMLNFFVLSCAVQLVFPPLAKPLFVSITYLTDLILTIIENPPAKLHFCIHGDLPHWIIFPYLLILFLYGIQQKNKTLLPF